MVGIDHALAAVILLLSAIQAFADPESVKSVGRRSFFLAGSLTGLALAATVLGLWALSGRSLEKFGLGWIGPSPTITFWAAGLWLAVLMVGWAVAAGPLRELVARHYGRYRHLMPLERGELAPAWTAGSLAAVGEELAFRGFLLWYLAHWLDPVAAVLVSSLIFGLAHGYQGRRGIALAVLAGLVLASAYLTCSSMVLAVWIHATYNIASFTLGYRLLCKRPDAV